MRHFTDLFQINGCGMFAPDEDVAISYADLDSDESGRDEGGVMHRIVVAYKLGTWSFTYSKITQEELDHMEALFENAPDFLFTHPARKYPHLPVTTRCYRSNYGVSWHNVREGVCKNYKFNIIACEEEAEQEDLLW